MLQDMDKPLFFRQPRTLGCGLENAVNLFATEPAALAGKEKEGRAVIRPLGQSRPERLDFVKQRLALVRERRLHRFQRTFQAANHN